MTPRSSEPAEPTDHADPTATLLLVDAANVVGSRPDGWWRDRAGAADRLVRRISSDLAHPGEVVVVLEGAARRGVEPGMAGAVRVVHAEGSGDDDIVGRVADAVHRTPGRAVTVVTADRGLRARVEELGAQSIGPGWLWQRLDQASAD
jgi:predicted RNA-binding protein with PIN domain